MGEYGSYHPILKEINILCGIGGIFTSRRHFNREEAEMCVRQLESLTRRGIDAWGYFDGTDVYKRPGDFVKSEESLTLADKILETGTNMFLCHTRRTTQGNPEHNPNNHPFELNPFIFSHNGIIKEADGFEDDSDIETDSYWLLWWIQNEFKKSRGKGYQRIVTAIDLGTDHVNGIYACWLFNDRDKGTYLFRMGNPIVEIQYYDDQDLLVFGSDGDSIVDTLGSDFLNRAGWAETVKVKSLTTNSIYRVSDAKIVQVGRFHPQKPEQRTIEDFYSTFGDLERYSS